MTHVHSDRAISIYVMALSDGPIRPGHDGYESGHDGYESGHDGYESNRDGYESDHDGIGESQCTRALV